MKLDRMHPEDVKAELRKRFGTIARFVAIHDLPETGVSDLLRGRTSQRVQDAVESALRGSDDSIELDSSTGRRRGKRSGRKVAA
jgi:hypothetical protein